MAHEHKKRVKGGRPNRIKKPKDSDTGRKRGLQIFLSFTSLLLTGLPVFVLLARVLELGPRMLVVGMTAWAISVMYVISRRKVIYVEEWAAYVTHDIFTGEMVVYGQGVHLCCWWEQRNAKGNYPLKEETETLLRIPFLTKKGEVTLTWMYTHAPNLSNLSRWVGMTADEFKEKMTEMVHSFLTVECIDAEPNELKAEDLTEALWKEFADEKGNVEHQQFESTEGSSGRIIGLIEVVRVDQPHGVVATQEAERKMKGYFQAVATGFNMTPDELTAALKSGEITHSDFKEARDRVMIAAGEKLNLTIVEGQASALATAAIAGAVNNQHNGKKGGN